MSGFALCVRQLWSTGLLVLVAHTLVAPCGVHARLAETKKAKQGLTDPDRVLVLDGRNVHNVGQLQMHVGNWGEFGSRPDTGAPFSWSPSAQWPAGSGVEYLFAAGLWVGALSSGVPAVSTATFEREFRPSQDHRDIVYRTTEGARGGNRWPDPHADDDRDGQIDEDWLDGRDNDGDALIDEDFAAISRLMFSTRYTDDQPVTREIYPEHNPLNIVVRQESYQWDGVRFDDFVGVQYRITNNGRQSLEDVYVGMFVDGDAGPRDRSNYWQDDLTGRLSVPVICTDLGPARFDVAYFYDADGDNGQTTGWFGVMFLGHTTDATGRTAPTSVGISNYAQFSGNQPFSLGGDPTNDFERYELLAQRTIERNANIPRDYRVLISTGPFQELPPESTLVVQVAFVIGEGRDGLVTSAANAKLNFDGAWFDLDRDEMTGIAGRETPVYGPAQSVWVDSCRKYRPPFEAGCDFERLDEMFAKPIPRIEDGEIVWTNSDCVTECIYKGACGFTERDSLMFRTGVAGMESQLHWIVDTAPPPPNIRVDAHATEGVVVYWDDFSETAPDNRTGRVDFEGYQIWRADDWTRPLGTSTITGPPTELWTALRQVDIINSFGPDTGLHELRYQPLDHLLAATKRRALINSLREQLLESPEKEPPCPQGVTPNICDTLKALARWELGVDGGRQYYRYVDRSMHLGRPYFYSVVAFDHRIDTNGSFRSGETGAPASNFEYVEPGSVAQPAYAYGDGNVYVVPNPATKESMAAWTLGPTNDDPSGIKVEFRNLPRARGVIRIFTLAGDLVQTISFDGRNGNGTVDWDLVSRNGQDITSGVYLYSVDSDGNQFDRKIGKFTVIR
ncbi:MAG: hypothetical protein OEN01_01415 [Candidatus Krumholzibacteria bacterium]|nr:hypothetical protein [Candidatus Krumholzibacteria bacterium]